MADGKTEAMGRQLDAAQAITHVGSWEWDLASGIVTWSDELYRIYGYAPRAKPITLDVFLAALHPDDRDRIRGNVEAAMQRGGRFSWIERVVRPDGSVRVLDTIGEVITNDAGAPTTLLGTCRDITEEDMLDKARDRAASVQSGERRALEMLAAGAPLQDILTIIVLMIEALSPETIASVLLLDESGQHLKHGAAPNLPDTYNRSIDGAAIGPKAGSCGTAAYRREPVLVKDITTDPLWTIYRHLLEPQRLRACSSFPILSSESRGLGTFAVYYKQPRT